MKIQLHKDSGLSIRDSQSNELLYRDSFENAVLDAELEQTVWPDENIIRIFKLADGRTAIVRETEAGLSQEEASPEIENFLALFRDNLEGLMTKQAERLTAGENPVESDNL